METAVFSGKGQRVERNLTAFAGSLIGALVIACVAVPWHFYGIQKERDEREKAVASIREASDARVKELDSKIAQLKGQQDCEGLKILVDSSHANARKMLGLVNEFPPFKTEAFKEVYVRLSAEANEQLSEATGLQNALKSDADDPRSKCIVASAGTKSPVLWNGASATLTAEGWMVKK